MKRKYDLEYDKYLDLLNKQDGKCAICRRPPKEGKVLCIDHNHITGRVRGLLCTPCNIWLANIDNDIETVGRILKYIQQPSEVLDGHQTQSSCNSGPIQWAM